MDFKDQMSDPVGTAARVLGELGIPADRDALEAYMARNQEQRHGSHSYTAEDFGLSEAELEQDFAFYQEGCPMILEAKWSSCPASERGSARSWPLARRPRARRS